MALGFTFDGKGQSTVSTPINAGGGIGPQNFNLGSLGIGTSGSFSTPISTGGGMPKWMLYGALALAALYIVVKVVRK